jgi:hypothetical protein
LPCREGNRVIGEGKAARGEPEAKWSRKGAKGTRQGDGSRQKEQVKSGKGENNKGFGSSDPDSRRFFSGREAVRWFGRVSAPTPNMK